MITAQSLNELSFTVEDEWVGTLLLAGLSDEYKPMIMPLENSGAKITGDFVEVKFLQEVKEQTNIKTSDTDSALYSKFGEKDILRILER